MQLMSFPLVTVARRVLICASFAAATASAQSPIVRQDNPLLSPRTPQAASAPGQKLDLRLSAPTRSDGMLPLDRIIAVVNNEVITGNDLSARLTTVARQLQKAGTALPPIDALQKQLLERMINDLVQIQEAKESGIRVDDGALDKTLQRLADDNNVSMSEFRRLLENDGVAWQKFREEIRGEVIMGRLQEREVDSNINVAEAEVDTQLALEARDATTDLDYRLAHILVQVPEQATAAQIETRRKRAMQALGDLRKGADFAQISAQFSDAPDALQGGDLGWRPAGRLPPKSACCLRH